MKIRQGFVSNSSSSNFILAFNEKPKSVDELKNLLFGDKETFGYRDFAVPTIDIAEAVYDQLNKPLNLDEILHELSSGWLDGVTVDRWDDPNLPEMWIKDQNGKEIYNPEYDDYMDHVKEKELVNALEYFNKWKCPDNQIYFCVSFGDENGKFDSLCEHGGIFDNIHNIQINHH